LLAAIQDVVKVEDEPAALPVDNSEAEPPAPVEGVDGKQPDAAVQDPSEAELATYSKGAKGRIEQLVKARNETRQQLEVVQPLVEQAQQFNAYLATNDLGADDVNLLMGVGAALRRGDFKTFLDGVRPYIEMAEQATGLRLPADLQSQVNDGYASEEVARELAQARFAAAHAQGELVHRGQRDQAQADEARRTDVRSATQSWEDGIRSRDPDYSVKQDAVRRYAQAIIAERGLPRTAQEAVQFANQAYEEVNKTFSAVRPAPKPTRLAPGSVHVPTSGTVAEPKTLMEAALLGLSRSRT
jgi:hypothetical protein